MAESKFDLKMHVRNMGYPVHYKSGVQKQRFLQRLRNVTANLTANIFGTKHCVHNPASVLPTTRGFVHRLKMS